MRTYFLLRGGEKCVFFVNKYVFWDIEVIEISWNIPFAKVEHWQITETCGIRRETLLR